MKLAELSDNYHQDKEKICMLIKGTGSRDGLELS
jgi:hypothetical protein